MKLTRRELLRKSCCAAAAVGMASSYSRFGLINALAQAPSNYQALVCIFLFGGNDANNMLIPMDTAGYANYLKFRIDVNSGGLALPQNTLLPITAKTAQNGETSFALHPNLTDVQSLYNSGKLAFLANVGPLSEPITKAQYQGKLLTIPANLFSHADQQQQWQTLELDGFYKTGWAGRMADNIEPIYNSSSLFPPITSVDGQALFGTGQATQ